jgi:hypothetical protein
MTFRYIYDAPLFRISRVCLLCASLHYPIKLKAKYSICAFCRKVTITEVRIFLKSVTTQHFCRLVDMGMKLGVDIAGGT